MSAPLHTATPAQPAAPRPGSPVDLVVDAPLHPAPAAAQADYELVAAMGRQLSNPLSTLESIVQGLLETGKISRRKVHMLQDELANIRRLSMQGQQLLRLAQSPLRQSHERVRLDSLVLQALQEQAQAFELQGIELVQRIQPVEIILDPGMVTSLVQAALDCAAQPGCRLLVTLEMAHWPEHGMLTLKSLQTLAAPTANADPVALTDSLAWNLLNQTARACGVLLGHSESAGHTSLSIEFPRTVRELQSLAQSELDHEEDSLSNVDSKMVAGQRILLITPDPVLRRDVTQLCAPLGLLLHSVLTPALAVRYCEFEKPRLIVIDERVLDTVFDDLRDDFVRAEPGFPVIGIADDSNTLSMSSWMDDSMVRIGRTDLASQLPRLLALELTKVL